MLCKGPQLCPGPLIAAISLVQSQELCGCTVHDAVPPPRWHRSPAAAAANGAWSGALPLQGGLCSAAARSRQELDLEDGKLSLVQGLGTLSLRVPYGAVPQDVWVPSVLREHKTRLTGECRTWLCRLVPLAMLFLQTRVKFSVFFTFCCFSTAPGEPLFAMLISSWI